MIGGEVGIIGGWRSFFILLKELIIGGIIIRYSKVYLHYFQRLFNELFIYTQVKRLYTCGSVVIDLIYF